MTTRQLEIHGTPSATQALRLHREIFTEEGRYELIYLAKANIQNLPFFEEWFMRRLETVTQQHFESSELAIWQVLERYLRSHGVVAPSQLDWWELHRTMFDLSTASTARMCGIRVPPDVVQRLSTIGFSMPEVLDFPALAFRMGLLYERLQKTKPVSWPELRRIVESRPLSPVETAAIQVARQRAGNFLRPVYDRAGQVWSGQREIKPLRKIVSAALRDRTAPRAVAKEIAESESAQGVFRDSLRIARTEIQECTNVGSFAVESKGEAPDALFFRLVSKDACAGCLRLLVSDDGTPKLYRLAEFEAGQQSVNTGPRDEWHVRVGPIHPQCRCPAPQKYIPEMQSIFAHQAERNRKMLVAAKLLKEAA